VAAGFGAPIAGVFFALECGNRCLARNTIRLDEDASDAPRSDIAAIVLAATMSNIIVQLFLQHRETLLIQGNSYAMISPFFELPVYFGLAVISGIISVVFDVVKSVFSNFYKIWDIPKYYRPLLGGLLCGIVAVRCITISYYFLV
jgi:H+/Cl- antiporter ClcA